MRVICALLFVFAVCQGTEEVIETLSKKDFKLGDVTHRTNLYNHLVKDYQKGVNPDNVNLTFGITLVDLDFNEKRNTLETNLWLKHGWSDSRLQWDVKEWGGINVIRAPSDVFWKPDLSLYNSADLSNSGKACWESNVLIYNTGRVLWVPPCHFSSFCKNTLKQHPYDPQTCTLKFGSWTFDSDIMDINFYDNKSTIDTEELVETSEWKVVGSTGEKHIKHYPCCPEGYADLTYNVTIVRKTDSAPRCHH